jgi:hypothetical protein
MDLCGGGTIAVGATSVTFSNSHPEPCTITSSTMPGWPTTPPVIPAKQGSNNGIGIVPISIPARAGDYTYTPNCCKKRMNPVIKVQ